MITPRIERVKRTQQAPLLQETQVNSHKSLSKLSYTGFRVMFGSKLVINGSEVNNVASIKNETACSKQVSLNKNASLLCSLNTLNHFSVVTGGKL